MTIQDLSKIIRELISSNQECIQLPGFGSFIVVDTPSELINEGKAITPPSRKIVFESSSDINDPYFAEKYAKVAGISLKAAKGVVAEFLSGFKRELVEKTRVEIPQFGTICFGEKGSFIFEAEPAFDFEADSYCLEIIPLKARSAMESSVSADDQEQNLEMEELNIELVDEQAEEQKQPEEAREQPEEVQQPEEAEVQAEEQKPAEEAEEAAEVQAEAEEQQPAEAKEAAEVQAEAEEQLEEQKPQEKQSEEHKLHERQEPQESQVPQEPQQAAVPQKRNWVLWGVVAAVGLIIVMVVLLFVFKEQLRPVLEQLLYSKEELEILHQAGF